MNGMLHVVPVPIAAMDSFVTISADFRTADALIAQNFVNNCIEDLIYNGGQWFVLVSFCALSPAAKHVWANFLKSRSTSEVAIASLYGV
jgi:hypothetical protein